MASSRRTSQFWRSVAARRAASPPPAGEVDAITTLNTNLTTVGDNIIDIEEYFTKSNPSKDSFGRMRVSEPRVIFESKQLFDNSPLFWDDSEVSGSGTTSTHSTARASTTIAVAATTAGKRVRQTKQRFNYQPGKSLLVMMTGILDKSGGGTGITSTIGYGDDNDGLFFVYDEGTLKVRKRSSVSGSPVDTDVSQGSFSEDDLDGTGPSGVTLDPSTTQIFWVDLEWLGVGTVRMGVIINGEFITAHKFHHANSATAVYMSTPNLPIRYAITNSGTGAASELEHICSTVISEAGIDVLGTLRNASLGASFVNANTAGTIYALVGIRLKSTHLDATIDLLAASVMSNTNDNYEWGMFLNPTVAGSFTYSDETNSAVQIALGDTAGNPSTNTVTGGTWLAGGYQKASGVSSANLDNAVRLGATIAGTRDEIVLCVKPLTANADIYGGLGWRELV